jgi:death-on-curing protein
MDIRFLTVDEALLIHTRSIEAHGGSMGIRDLGLLQSALAMPHGGFGGQFLHEFPHEMAAAYLFHVAANHPFIDGNKRTALLCALMFLDLNGYALTASKKLVEETVLRIASGQMEKSDVSLFFKQHIRRL